MVLGIAVLHGRRGRGHGDGRHDEELEHGLFSVVSQICLKGLWTQTDLARGEASPIYRLWERKLVNNPLLCLLLTGFRSQETQDSKASERVDVGIKHLSSLAVK